MQLQDCVLAKTNQAQASAAYLGRVIKAACCEQAGEYEYMADPMRASQPHTKGEKVDQGKPFMPAHNANNEFGHIPVRHAACSCSAAHAVP